MVVAVTSDDLRNSTVPFAPAPAQLTQPVLPAHKTPKKGPIQQPAGSRPSGSRTPAREHHVHEHRHQHKGGGDDGSADSDGDSDGDVPRDLRPVPAERDLYSVSAFCARHSISRDKLYELWREGLGPEWIHISSRRYVTREAGARWRKALERGARERKLKRG
jgi:hypothetical protein